MSENNAKIYPFTTLPGIKRDGTGFEGNYHVDGQWTRWQRGLPRKIGGYIEMGRVNYLARGCNLFPQNGVAYIHFGASSGVYQVQAPMMGNTIGITYDRAPSGFTPDDNMIWQFGVMYDATSTTTRIITHGAPNLEDIDNSTTGKIYLGDITGTGALIEVSSSDVSGGIAVLHPYLFYFGSNGLLGWSNANQPSDLTGGDSGEGRVTGGKVLYGTQTRAGAGNAPAGLFWATDALIRAVYVGGAALFNFDRIAESYSILSSQCIVEYDGIYYWIGIDRFFAYNGVIQEVPNKLNRNYFFDNLNTSQRQKVWGEKITAFGEIWWHFPFGDSDECNAVIMFNIRENTWYDSRISRTTGYFANIYPNPIMFDSAQREDGTYSLWKHEYGVDQVEGASTLAIPAWYETSDMISQPFDSQNQPLSDTNMEYFRIEPDFVLAGTMNGQVLGKKYPQDIATLRQEFTFTQVTQKVDIKTQARINRFRFESNEAGGNFQCGDTLLKIDSSDRRPV